MRLDHYIRKSTSRSFNKQGKACLTQHNHESGQPKSLGKAYLLQHNTVPALRDVLFAGIIRSTSAESVANKIHRRTPTQTCIPLVRLLAETSDPLKRPFRGYRPRWRAAPSFPCPQGHMGVCALNPLRATQSQDLLAPYT